MLRRRHQNCQSNGQTIFSWFPPLLGLAHPLAKPCAWPNRLSGLLVCDRGERDEIVGAARDGLLASC